MNEKIALFFENAKNKSVALSKSAKERLAALSKKQLMIAGSSVAAAVIIVAVFAVVGTGSDAEKNDKTAVTVGETAYAMSVDGQEIVYVPTEEDAKAVIDGILAAYTTPGSEITEYAFQEEILYEEKDIVTAAEAAKDSSLAETYVCTVEEAVSYIINGTSTPVTYTVKGGDTLWDIALASNISVYELQQMNEGKFENLSIGETINLYQKNPFVHVVTKEVVTATESIPYSTTYTNSDSLYKGQVKVQSAGVNGSKETTVEIAKTNGVETARTVLSETVISQPVTQVALKGTKTMPITAGSGVLQSPVASIEIASSFGASRGGGTRSHKGIDLRAPKGTAFMAADSGTVTFAGWKSSYGKLIIIDHGNGIQTKYAHCDSISVSAGQTVSKGQVIGTIGSTGNATGNVLHFEVLVNGVAKNPVNYL